MAETEQQPRAETEQQPRQRGGSLEVGGLAPQEPCQE
jgi:hypothetical protein